MTVLSIIVKVSVLTAFGLLAVRLARRRRASVRHVLLTATLLLPVLVPFITVFGPTICVVVPTPPSGPPPVFEQPVIAGAPSQVEPATSPHSDKSSSPASSWQSWLAAGWAMGAAISCWPVLAGSLRVPASSAARTSTSSDFVRSWAG